MVIIVESLLFPMKLLTDNEPLVNGVHVLSVLL